MHYLFWIPLTFILYTYVIYPLGVVAAAACKRRKPVPDMDPADLPPVTFIIVVYNEEARIAQKLDNCRAQRYPQHLLNICIVSDGSTDGTNDILHRQHGIEFITDASNRGKPHQINRAAQRSRSDIIVFSDARQQFEQDAVAKLVRNFSDPAVGAVSGELVFRAPQDHTGKSIGLYWMYEKVIRKAESDVGSTLGATGAIYAIRRELFSPIPDDTILDDIEIPLGAFKRGYRIIFEPEAIAYDTASSEIGSEFNRKARTLAGNFQLFARNRWLLNPLRNRIFVQAVSHKLLRLYVPYAMILMLAGAGMTASLPFTILFYVQLIAYAVGAAAVFSATLRKNRLLNVISVFLSLNAAAVAGLYRFTCRKSDARWRRQHPVR